MTEGHSPSPPAPVMAPGPVRRNLARMFARASAAASRTVARLLGTTAAEGRPEYTEQELRDLVATSRVLNGEERRIIDEVIAAGQSLVREVMVPRTEVAFLPGALTVAEAIPEARQSGYSRYPVIDKGADDVLGFVHIRDLLFCGEPATAVRDLARDLRRLPASKAVLPALSEMRREGQHLALVVDEYGGTAGIIALEDLIEELVGEIHDEYDDQPEPVGVAGRPPAEVDGLLNLGDFAERCGFVLPDGPYETVGGFIMARLGRLAVLADEVFVGGGPTAWRLTVNSMEGRRIARVGVRPALPAARSASAEAVVSTTVVATEMPASTEIQAAAGADPTASAPDVVDTMLMPLAGAAPGDARAAA